MCTVAVIVQLTGPARATDSREASAELLFREGRALLERKDYQAACTKLARSHQLDAALGTLLLLAFCHEKVGRTATAYAEYTRAVVLAEQVGDLKKAQAARSWAEALLPKLSMVELDVVDPVPGLRIEIDRATIGRVQWGERIPVDPGRHVVRAVARQHQAFETEIRVPAGPGATAVRIPALEPAHPSRELGAERRGSGPSPVPGLLAAGVGVVGVGVGSFFGLRAISRNNEAGDYCDSENRCQDRGLELQDQALRDARISTVAMAIGAVGLTTGAILLWPHISGNASVEPTQARVGIAVAF